MNTVSKYQRPVIFGRWPARAEARPDLAAKVLETLNAVNAALRTDSMEWSADTGDDTQFTMLPFPTNINPENVDLEPFIKLDDANQVWIKGGLAILLYGRIGTWPEGEVVAVTGTVGATTRRGNSLKIAFLTEDRDRIPSGKDISTLVESVGEVWDTDWCAAMSDEIVDAVNRPHGEPGVGFATYWSDGLGRELPAADGVTLRKTAKGCLAEVSRMDVESAIDYGRKAQKESR
jgi:hypothetical protein